MSGLTAKWKAGSRKTNRMFKGQLAHSLVAAQGGAVHQARERSDANQPSHASEVVFLRVRI